MRKWLKRIAVVIAIIVAIPLLTLAYWMKGPNRSYRVDYVIQSDAVAEDEPLLVGAAMRDITPPFAEYDPWTDVNGDSRYNPEDGDTYDDANENGICDADEEGTVPGEDSCEFALDGECDEPDNCERR